MASARLAYSLDEAAEVCSVSRRTICRLVSSKELPSIKIGQRTLVRTVDLETYLASKVGL
jgi:excisionase family DNA binding protein